MVERLRKIEIEKGYRIPQADFITQLIMRRRKSK